MRKIVAFLAVIGLVVFSSCTGPEGPPGIDGSDALIPQVFEIKNVNLGRVADNEYNLKRTFKSTPLGGDLFDDETVLVYRLTGTINSSTPIWQLIPRTIYFNNGDVLDYYFDFSRVDFIITARGSFNLLNSPSYIDNQTFRVVIIPANFAASVNKNNYSEVIKALNINESKIQKVNF